MKKLIVFLVVASVILFSSCVSFSNEVKRHSDLQEDKGYIAGYFPEYLHVLQLENLETKKRIRLRFEGAMSVTVAAVPPGKYSVVSFSRSDPMRDRDFRIPIPYGMMKIIDARAGDIIYLGNVEYTPDGVFGSFGKVYHYFDNENAELAIKRNYRINFQYRFVSIQDVE